MAYALAPPRRGLGKLNATANCPVMLSGTGQRSCVRCATALMLEAWTSPPSAPGLLSQQRCPGLCARTPSPLPCGEPGPISAPKSFVRCPRSCRQAADHPWRHCPPHAMVAGPVQSEKDLGNSETGGFLAARLPGGLEPEAAMEASKPIYSGHDSGDDSLFACATGCSPVECHLSVLHDVSAGFSA